MKKKLNLVWRLAIALVLVIGFTMAMAPPVAAEGVETPCVETGACSGVECITIISPTTEHPAVVKPGISGKDSFEAIFKVEGCGEGIFEIILGNYSVLAGYCVKFSELPDCTVKVSVTVPTTVPNNIYDLMVTGKASGQSLPKFAVSKCAVIVDNKAPDVCLTEPIDGSYVRECVNVEAVVTDDASGVGSVQFAYRAQGFTEWSCIDGAVTCPPAPEVCKTWDTRCLPDGKYELAALVTDKAGNSCISKPICVTVDNTPPTIPAITSPQGGERWLNGEIYNISWNTPSDTNFKGVIIDLLNKDGTLYKNIASGLPAAGPYAWKVDGVVAGDYSIRITAKDLAGNCSWADSKYFSIYSLDNSRPEVKLTVAPSTSINGIDWIKGKVDLIADAEDDNSGIAYVEFIYSITNGAPWIEIGKDYSAPYGMPFDTTCLADGTKVEIQAIAYNTTGAWSSDTKIFFVDNSPPVVCIVGPLSGFYPDGLTITASAFDQQTGIQCVEFYYSTDPLNCLDKKWHLIGYGVYDSVKCVYTAQWSDIPEGTYLLRAKAVNRIDLVAESNVEKDKSFDIVIDKTPPTALAMIAPNGGELIKIGSNFDIKWVPAKDAHLADCPITIELLRGSSLAVVSIITANHSNSGCFTWENIRNIIPGNDYKIRITAADKAGNCYAVCSANYFTIAADWDPTAPNVTLVCPGNNAAVRSLYVINAEASDPETGIQKVVFDYSLNGGVAWVNIAEDAYAPFSVTWDTTGINDSKNVMVRATAYNGVGVCSSAISTGIYIDNSCHGKPTVNINPVFCPTNSFPIITGVAADDWSGIGMVKVAFKNADTGKYWDGQGCWVAAQTWLNATGCESWAFDARCIPFSTDTYFEIYAQAFDKAGNASDIDMECFICKTDKLNLKPGWNFISVPQKVTSDYDTFGELLNGFDKCKAFAIVYDCDGKMVWSPLCSDSPVEVLSGYWVLVPPEHYPSGIYLKVRYDFNTTSLATKNLVGKAWNAIGPSGNSFGECHEVVKELISITTSTTPPAGSWSTLVSWNSAYQRYDPAILIIDIANLIDPPMMETGRGYWIFITNPCGDTLCEITT